MMMPVQKKKKYFMEEQGNIYYSLNFDNRNTLTYDIWKLFECILSHIRINQIYQSEIILLE